MSVEFKEIKLLDLRTLGWHMYTGLAIETVKISNASWSVEIENLHITNSSEEKVLLGLTEHLLKGEPIL